jgi:26S proteasome regulatory subunit N3
MIRHYQMPCQRYTLMVRECCGLGILPSSSFADSPVRASLLSWLPAAPPPGESMEVDTASPPKPPPETVPETEIYFRLLILHHLLTSPSSYSDAIGLANETVQKIQSLNRRSMDPIAAKVWFALERAYELGGELSDARPFVLWSPPCFSY